MAWSPICAATEGFPFQNNFLLWLKYYKDYFRQESINLYPLGVQAVAIVANLVVAWHMDYSGKRVPMVGLVILLQVVVGSMLIVKSLSFVGTFFAFYLAGTAYAVNPLIFGWANIILQRTGDDAMRSITLYSMNIGSMVLWTGWGIVSPPFNSHLSFSLAPVPIIPGHEQTSSASIPSIQTRVYLSRLLTSSSTALLQR